MAQVRVEDVIAAAPAAVWEIAADFGGIKRWTPSIGSCTLEGEGVGAVRRIEMNGMTIRERLEKLDEAARSLSYSIVEGPLPFRDYLATIEIHDGSGGGTRIVWYSTFEAAGMPDEQAQQMVEMIYRQGIAGMRKALMR